MGHDHPPTIGLTIGCDPTTGGSGRIGSSHVGGSAQVIKPTGIDDQTTGAR